jgi:hypothetical protein
MLPRLSAALCLPAHGAAEHLTSLGRIHVDTDENGIVWLSGHARSQEAIDKAVAIAGDTEGVKSVHNTIKIAKDDWNIKVAGGIDDAVPRLVPVASVSGIGQRGANVWSYLVGSLTQRLSCCWGCRPAWLIEEKARRMATIATVTMTCHNEIMLRIVMISAAKAAVAMALMKGTRKTAGTSAANRNPGG